MSQLAAAVPLVGLAARALGLALVSAAVAGGVAVVYRLYARDRVPDGAAVLFGVATVAAYLNTTAAFKQAMGGTLAPLSPAAAAYTIATVAVAAVAADGGRRLADRIAVRLFSMTGSELDDVSRIVRSRGRVLTVELPAEVDDVDGYDPVDEETRAAIAGERLRFPRGLTVAELRERLVARLRDDYGVGRVDVELDDDGAVSYLAVGGRAAGIGPTLPPGTVAVAVRADPPHSASPGDRVQLWTGGEEPRRVTTAELRATAGDVATLAVDAADADAIDPATDYRLVTAPAAPRADHEFVALLRRADETMGTVTVAPGSPLAGAPVGAVDATVVAVRDGSGVDPIPSRDRLLAPGDAVYVVARPDALRRFEAAAGGTA